MNHMTVSEYVITHKERRTRTVNKKKVVTWEPADMTINGNFEDPLTLQLAVVVANDMNKDPRYRDVSIVIRKTLYVKCDVKDEVLSRGWVS